MLPTFLPYQNNVHISTYPSMDSKSQWCRLLYSQLVRLNHSSQGCESQHPETIVWTSTKRGIPTLVLTKWWGVMEHHHCQHHPWCYLKITDIMMLSHHHLGIININHHLTYLNHKKQFHQTFVSLFDGAHALHVERLLLQRHYPAICQSLDTTQICCPHTAQAQRPVQQLLEGENTVDPPARQFHPKIFQVWIYRMIDVVNLILVRIRILKKHPKVCHKIHIAMYVHLTRLLSIICVVNK